MADLDKTTLENITAMRATYFTPRWFGELLRGRLTPGDTFWIGNFGIELFVVPALVFGTMLLALSNPSATAPMLGVAFASTGLYRLALLRGLWITSRVAGLSGWHWTGLGTTLFFALIEVGVAVSNL
jgi:hypothetical protein